MTNSVTQIDFTAPATLMKCPSLKGQRIPVDEGGCPYTVSGGTLDDCVALFQSKHLSQQHLYEIHTAAQGSVVTEVLSASQIAELIGLQEFL